MKNIFFSVKTSSQVICHWLSIHGKYGCIIEQCLATHCMSMYVLKKPKTYSLCTMYSSTKGKTQCIYMLKMNMQIPQRLQGMLDAILELCQRYTVDTHCESESQTAWHELAIQNCHVSCSMSTPVRCNVQGPDSNHPSLRFQHILPCKSK